MLTSEGTEKTWCHSVYVQKMYYECEKDYATFDEFSEAVEEYIVDYNDKRIQAKTKWMIHIRYRAIPMRLI